MKTKIVLLCITALVTACATPARYEYTKEGASEFQRTDAMSECRYQIRLNKTPATEEAELIKLCMQGKGYRIKRVN